MKINIHFILLSLFAMLGCSSDSNSENEEPVKTVIYLIRHAEKADASADPDLSAAGLTRANNWAVIFEDVTFDAFYSTDYKRTKQTIQPTATRDGKTVVLYNPSTFTLAGVVAAHPGKNIFIVGHSNTIPALINTYIGSNVYPDMAESEFGNLYKVTVEDGEITHGMTVHN
jgi:2,3-bisphosphoglycerate-dependent phosphoglycerate mutase